MVQLVHRLTQSLTLGPLINPKNRAAHFMGLTICSASRLAMWYRLNWFMKASTMALSPSKTSGGFPPSFPPPWVPPTGGPPPPGGPKGPPPAGGPPGRPPPPPVPPGGPPPVGGWPSGFFPFPRKLATHPGCFVPARVSAAAAVESAVCDMSVVETVIGALI
jgi:hypothetical protein